MKVALTILGTALTLLHYAPSRAQQAPAEHSQEPATHSAEPRPRADYQALPTAVFLLKNSTQPNDGNEVLTGLRLILDASDRLYLVPNQQEILIKAPPEELARAQELVDEMDRPHKSFIVTYTVTDLDAGKKVGVQRFTMNVAGGTRTVLKEGSKVPIVSASYGKDKTEQSPQVTYLDVGLNFDVTINDSQNAISLKSRVEQSSVAQDKSGSPGGDPLIRETSLDGVSLVVLGKLTSLGSIDIPGSTRHLDIEVTVEPAR